MKTNFLKFWKVYLISFVASFVIGVAIFLIYFFVKGINMYSAVDAVSCSAIILLGIGGLMYVANEGFFDIFSYGFKQMFSSMFAKKANENNDFAAYKDGLTAQREMKAKIYLSVLASGAIFLIAMIVVRIVAATI